jgi:hypothetical protein
MGDGMLPCHQMAQAVLEEGVDRSKVKSCSQVKQAGTIVRWLSNTMVEVEFVSDIALFLLCIEVPQDNHLIVNRGLLQVGKQHKIKGILGYILPHIHGCISYHHNQVLPYLGLEVSIHQLGASW